MELDVFAGQEKSELSMIEVARAILETRGRDNEMYFNDLVNEIQNYLEKSDADIRNALPFFYSDLNTDGSFIPLGDNKWGLRSWYAIDEIDEEVITLEDTDENAPKRKNKKVNAFMMVMKMPSIIMTMIQKTRTLHLILIVLNMTTIAKMMRKPKWNLMTLS